VYVGGLLGHRVGSLRHHGSDAVTPLERWQITVRYFLCKRVRIIARHLDAERLVEPGTATNVFKCSHKAAYIWTG